MKGVGLLLVCAGLVAPLAGTLLAVLGLVVIVFGRIVDYGCILQEQDDRLL